MAHWSQVVSVVNYSASEAMASWQLLEALLWSQPHRSCWSVQKIAPRPAWSKVYENTSKEKSTWFKNFDRRIRMQIIFPIFIELQYEKSRNKDIDKEGFYISFSSLLMLHYTTLLGLNGRKEWNIKFFKKDSRAWILDISHLVPKLRSGNTFDVVKDHSIQTENE